MHYFVKYSAIKYLAHNALFNDPFLICYLAQMFVFCEEIVQDSESGLEIQIDNILRSGLGLG